MQGRLGVDLATKHEPDLILLDLHLPDIPGIEVLRLIQEDPRTRDIQPVTHTASRNEREMSNARLDDTYRSSYTPIAKKQPDVHRAPITLRSFDTTMTSTSNGGASIPLMTEVITRASIGLMPTKLMAMPTSVAATITP